jgi:hypothetical protein
MNGPICACSSVCVRRLRLSSQPHIRISRGRSARADDHECFAPCHGASFIQRAVLVLTLNAACMASVCRDSCHDYCVTGRRAEAAFSRSRTQKRVVPLSLSALQCHLHTRAHVEYDVRRSKSTLIATRRTQWGRGNAILMRGRANSCGGRRCCCIIFRTSDRKKPCT